MTAAEYFRYFTLLLKCVPVFPYHPVLMLFIVWQALWGQRSRWGAKKVFDTHWLLWLPTEWNCHHLEWKTNWPVICEITCACGPPTWWCYIYSLLLLCHLTVMFSLYLFHVGDNFQWLLKRSVFFNFMTLPNEIDSEVPMKSPWNAEVMRLPFNCAFNGDPLLHECKLKWRTIKSLHIRDLESTTIISKCQACYLAFIPYIYITVRCIYFF